MIDACMDILEFPMERNKAAQELYTAIFAVARIAGWSAHRIEEIQLNGKIIRPAYINVKNEEKYIPLEER